MTKDEAAARQAAYAEARRAWWKMAFRAIEERINAQQMAREAADRNTDKETSK